MQISFGFTLLDTTGNGVAGATISAIKIAPLSGAAATTLGSGITVETGTAPTAITPTSVAVTILDAGDGDYVFVYDAEAYGEALLKFTCSKGGVTISRGGLVTVDCTRNSSRILSGISATGAVTIGGYAAGEDPATLLLLTPGHKLATDSSGGVTVGGYEAGEDPGTLVLATPAHKLATDASGDVSLSLSQALDLTQLGDTVGGALNAAVAAAFGKWVVTGTPGSAGSTLKLYDAAGTTLLRTFDLSTAGSRV